MNIALRRRMAFGSAVLGTAIVLLGVPDARAVPSFARQMGMPCNACHTAGFYPELNHFGRMFKLNGYLWSAHPEKPYEPHPPVSAAQQWSYTHTDEAQPGLERQPTVGFASGGNDNFSYPQQTNFFLAGRYYGRLGGFLMGTYSGTDDAWAFDNVDIRLTDVHTFGAGHTLVYGATLNNGPSVQDVWNTLPAWSQLIASEVAPGPAAAPSLSNLIAQVAGVGAYAFWDDFLYAETTAYLSGTSGPFAFLTTGDEKATITDGVSPYWRVALYRSRGSHSLSLGHVGLYDEAHQTGASGPSNRFLDLGGDLQYQWNARPHFVSLRAAFIWENQDLRAARGVAAATHLHDDLQTVQLWASYYWYDTIGVTLGFFDVMGRRDPLLYAPEPVDGSRTGRPDTIGGSVQLSLLPFSRWFHESWPALPMTQLAVQYTFYGTFNGASSNYDGFGRAASDNNTVYLVAWTPW